MFKKAKLRQEGFAYPGGYMVMYPVTTEMTFCFNSSVISLSCERVGSWFKFISGTIYDTIQSGDREERVINPEDTLAARVNASNLP